jgi:hypothetical protein
VLWGAPCEINTGMMWGTSRPYGDGAFIVDASRDISRICVDADCG